MTLHTFPSGVDTEHFATARGDQPAPDDQHPGFRPRLGFFGVIDGRVDLELAGWDVAILPFVVNEATRFINPHQTLECLATGRPVVSTAIPHVVHPFPELGLVRVADRKRFVSECAVALARADHAAFDRRSLRESGVLGTDLGEHEAVDARRTEASLSASAPYLPSLRRRSHLKSEVS